MSRWSWPASMRARSRASALPGDTRRVLMLCARRPVSAEPIDRNRLAQALANQSISTSADAYMADLRANAIIRQP